MVPTGGKILSQGGIVLSQENLECFRIKSEFLVPACFGGFNPNDPVCQHYCFRARQNDLDSSSWHVETRMNERNSSSGGFFYRDPKFQKSCQRKREELEDELEKVSKEIREELARHDSQRATRDHFYLAENSDGLGRIPVGEIKIAEDFRDFTKSVLLYLETPNRQHFANPYGPKYDEAVGRIYELHPGGCPPFFDAATTFGFVKSTDPKLPDAQRYRLEVISQKANKAGDLILEAKIIEGSEVTIELFGESAKERIKVDDREKL